MRKLIFVAMLASIFGTGVAQAGSDEKDDKDFSIGKESAPRTNEQTIFNQTKNISKGKFSTCTPDPFTLCSHPRPPKKDPMRKCWDEVCNS